MMGGRRPSEKKKCLIRPKTVKEQKILRWKISEIMVNKKKQEGIFVNYRTNYLTEFDRYIDIVLILYMIRTKLHFLLF